MPETTWKGGTVQGGACAIALATRPEEAPLTDPPWRAAQSEADEATVSVQACLDPMAAEDWAMRQECRDGVGECEG